MSFYPNTFMMEWSFCSLSSNVFSL